MGKSINWVAAALVLVVAYFVIVITAIGPSTIVAFFRGNNQLNTVGDFLAGVFAFPAFILLGMAVIMQRQELNDARAQAADSAKLIKAQLDQVEQQNRITHKAAKANYRLAVHEKRMLAYHHLTDARTTFLREGVEGNAVFNSLRLASIQAEFIFGPEIETFITDVLQHSYMLRMFTSRLTKSSEDRKNNPDEWDETKEKKFLEAVTGVERETLRLSDIFMTDSVKNKFLPYLEVPLSLDETE